MSNPSAIPDLNLILKGIASVLRTEQALTYFGSNVYEADDILSLLRDSEFPLINVDLMDNPFTITNSDNIREYDSVRFNYAFRLQYATVHEDRATALFGDSTLNPIFKGSMGIHDDLYAVLMNNKTLGGLTYGMKVIGTQSRVFLPEVDKQLYIAGAETSIVYWKDVNLR